MRIALSVALAVASPPPGRFVVEMAGFHPREYEGARTWRWMGSAARWTIHAVGAGPRAAVLEIELSAFPAARRLDVWLDGARVAQLEVPAASRRFRIGPLGVRAASSVLEFRPLEAPVVADRVLGNGDPRALSIAVHEWRWVE